jgi:hypothetical protein
MTENCPWCWAELGPDDVMCPACEQQARRAGRLEAASEPAPAPTPTLPNRPPIPPAQRGELIVTNPERAPLWQRFLLVMYKLWQVVLRVARELLDARPWHW